MSCCLEATSGTLMPSPICSLVRCESAMIALDGHRADTSTFAKHLLRVPRCLKGPELGLITHTSCHAGQIINQQSMRDWHAEPPVKENGQKPVSEAKDSVTPTQDGQKPAKQAGQAAGEKLENSAVAPAPDATAASKKGAHCCFDSLHFTYTSSVIELGSPQSATQMRCIMPAEAYGLASAMPFQKAPEVDLLCWDVTLKARFVCSSKAMQPRA